MKNTNIHLPVLRSVTKGTIELSAIDPQAMIITIAGMISGMIKMQLTMESGLGHVRMQISKN